MRYIDKFFWPKIVSTASDENPVFHMDYSKNLLFTLRIEPQPAHFSEKQSSLHYSVIYTNEDEELVNNYVYNLSGDNSTMQDLYSPALMI